MRSPPWASDMGRTDPDDPGSEELIERHDYRVIDAFPVARLGINSRQACFA
ncbi:MAG TPA: hypothetical protein PKD84_05460 [Propionicimonas sp.]|nr:hypothetical protein [Propionicimonas sp.]